MNIKRWRSLSKSKTHPEISLTPLIDTVLVLLVIFMVTSPMMQNSLKIDLPKGTTSKGEATPKDLVIYIDAKKKIYINDEPVLFNDLAKSLEKILGSSKGQVARVDGDKNISYQDLIDVVDRVSSVDGIDNVVLSTQRT